MSMMFPPEMETRAEDGPGLPFVNHNAPSYLRLESVRSQSMTSDPISWALTVTLLFCLGQLVGVF